MPGFIWELLAIFFGAMNLTAVCAALLDKWKAKRHTWRVPERTLLLLGLFGGALGEFLIMLLIRHKTRHPKFMVLLPLFSLLHIALLGFLYWKF